MPFVGPRRETGHPAGESTRARASIIRDEVLIALQLRAADQNARQQTNIAAAVRRNELFEFLVDIVPPNEQSGAVRSEAPPLASAAQQDQEADAATARTSAVIDQLLQSMQASQASAQAGNFAAGESGASAIVTTASDRGDGSSSAQGINSGGGLASAPLQSELPTEPPAKRIRVDWDCP